METRPNMNSSLEVPPVPSTWQEYSHLSGNAYKKLATASLTCPILGETLGEATEAQLMSPAELRRRPVEKGKGVGPRCIRFLSKSWLNRVETGDQERHLIFMLGDLKATFHYPLEPNLTNTEWIKRYFDLI